MPRCWCCSQRQSRILAGAREQFGRNVAREYISASTRQGVAFDRIQLLGSLPVTFADDTTLRRRQGQEHTPHVFVQATIVCASDDAVVPLLQRRARRSMFKWGDVGEFVLSRASDDAARARSRLEEATIMIVDPSAFLRTMDLSAASPKNPPFLSRQVQTDPRFRMLRRVMTRRVGRVLLIHSGAEHVYSLVRSPLIGEGGFYDPEFSVGGEKLDGLDPLAIAERTPDLNKLSRIALQTTALVAHEHDANTRIEFERYLVAHRWMPDGWINQARLEALAKRSIVYDRGHEDSTSIAAKLHQAACERVNNCPRRWANPEEPDAAVGQVRTGITRDEVPLQMADVAAGWASSILASRGAVALAKTFRIVLYNGVPLDHTQAEKLDTERRFHDRLIARAP